jgi:hypothetical protein
MTPEASMYTRLANTLCPPAIGGAFDAAQNDGDAAIGRGGADGIEMSRLDGHSLIEIHGMECLLDRRIEPRAVGVFDPEGVAGDERFAECDEIDGGVGGFVEAGENFIERGGAIEPGGGDLGGGDTEVGGGHE